MTYELRDPMGLCNPVIQPFVYFANLLACSQVVCYDCGELWLRRGASDLRRLLGLSNHKYFKRNTATRCNMLQLTATHSNTLQHTAIHCNILLHAATHCNTLQHTATRCDTLHCTATYRYTLRHTAHEECNNAELWERSHHTPFRLSLNFFVYIHIHIRAITHTNRFVLSKRGGQLIHIHLYIYMYIYIHIYIHIYTYIYI